MDEAGGLTLRVLGELDAIRDGVVVELGGRRQRAALAALIIARGEVLSAERLAECVWGDGAASRNLGGLHSYVSHLRAKLQPDSGARSRNDVITRIGRGYALCLGQLDVDAWQFEQAVEIAADLPASERVSRLSSALDLWRGPAYAEYADGSWVRTEVARLTELRTVARESLMDARLALGNAPRLVPELEALVAEDPLREERWRLLVLALYRAHRQGDALAALRRARQTLSTELGVEPGPALRTLERDVLAQSPTLQGPARMRQEASIAEPPPTKSPQNGGVPTDLVDRDHELAALSRAVADLRAGTGGTVLIEGSAGIGKTRLLVEAGRFATNAGLRVMTARASELERTFGFGTVRQLFEPSLIDPARRATLLGGAAAGARGVFDGVDDDRVDGSFAVLHGLYWLTINLTAEGPVLLAIDDVQWSDGASLRFLAYLVKRIEGLPILLALTLRTGERRSDDALLDEMLLEPFDTVLRPQALSATAAGAVVRSRLSEADDAFVQTCHRTTSGNPLLLRQLVRALESEGVPPDVVHADTVRAVGSRAVASLVMLRLRRMPATVIEVVRAVALIGQDADLPAISALAQLPEENVAEALDLLSRNEILADTRPLRFVHPLVQDAVYRDLTSAECALRHERAARILQERGASTERIAANLLLAPARGDPATVAVLQAAARAASARGASDSAITFLRRALEEPPAGRDRVEVLIELGSVEALVDGEQSVSHLIEAYDELADPADARRRADLALVIARTQAFAARRGAASAFARDAAASLPAAHDDARQGLVALARVAGYMHGLPPAEYRSSAGTPGRRRRRRRAHARGGGGLRADARRRRPRRRDRVGQIRPGGRPTAGPRRHVALGGRCRRVAGRRRRRSRRPRPHCRFRRSVAPRAGPGACHGQPVRGARGEPVAGLRAVAPWPARRRTAVGGDATEQIRTWGGPRVGDPFAAAFTAGIHLDRGDIDAAERTVAAARTLPRIGEGARHLRHATARLRLAQGQPAGGPRRTPTPMSDTSTSPTRPGLPGGTRRPARWSRSDASTRRWRWPTSRSRCSAGGVRRPHSARRCSWPASCADRRAFRLLREAVDLLTPTGADLDLARARLALGRRPELDADEAIPLLRAAAAGAGDCGARPVLDARWPRWPNAASGRFTTTGRPATRLTGRERQVLDLTATGLDVHQVAQRLFLTPGTVHSVLSAATAKIGAAPMTRSSDSQVSGRQRSAVVPPSGRSAVTRPSTTPAGIAGPADLRRLCGGAVYLPGDPQYDEARRPWNLRTDDHPAAVAYPAFPDEVAELVRAAAAAGLRIAPQGTGHGAPPLSGQLADAVLLRTSAMTELRIDAAHRTARVGAGVLWGDVIARAGAARLACRHMSSPSVGVVGSSLGGGLNWYGRSLRTAVQRGHRRRGGARRRHDRPRHRRAGQRPAVGGPRRRGRLRRGHRAGVRPGPGRRPVRRDAGVGVGAGPAGARQPGRSGPRRARTR